MVAATRSSLFQIHLKRSESGVPAVAQQDGWHLESARMQVPSLAGTIGWGSDVAKVAAWVATAAH